MRKNTQYLLSEPSIYKFVVRNTLHENNLNLGGEATFSAQRERSLPGEGPRAPPSTAAPRRLCPPRVPAPDAGTSGWLAAGQGLYNTATISGGTTESTR